MQWLNVIYCAELCQEHNVQWPLVNALYSWGSGGAVSPLASPGQSAGGREAPGSSEKFAFYSTKKRPNNTYVVLFFSVLNTMVKNCQIQLTHWFSYDNCKPSFLVFSVQSLLEKNTLPI